MRHEEAGEANLPDDPYNVLVGREQLAAAARPVRYLPIVVLIAWMVTAGLLLDLPRSAASAPIFAVVTVFYAGAFIVFSRRRRERPRTRVPAAARWLSSFVVILGALLVWTLGYQYIDKLTPLPYTVAASAVGMYLLAAALLINRVLGTR